MNLERPMKSSDRFGGHLVTGHVDATGHIRGILRRGDMTIFTFEIPKDLAPHLVPKGSIAIDGISLTINDVQGNRFTVTLIPHTLKMTTLGFKRIGHMVNIEMDIIGKYVEKFISLYMGRG